MDRGYKVAVTLAKERLADARRRGDAAVGGDWDELEKELFSQEEISASDARVAVMNEAVHARVPQPAKSSTRNFVIRHDKGCYP